MSSRVSADDTSYLMNHKGTLYTVAGPSGVGKSSLVSLLEESVPGVRVSISCTTRPQQPGETDNDHYHFITPQKFREMLDNGDFLEHAEVFGHLYGTPGQWVKDTLAAGEDVILEIDWQGALQVKEQTAGSVAIFILPPDAAILQARLVERGRDDEETIKQRLAEAEIEIQQSHYADYLVINENFQQALADLQAIVHVCRLQYGQQKQRHRTLLNTLTKSSPPLQ